MCVDFEVLIMTQIKYILYHQPGKYLDISNITHT